jgi:2-dehydropantoate 2-reductase
VIARGPQLAAIRDEGLTLDFAGDRFTVDVPASDNPADFGPQDYVILTAKTTGLAAIAPQLGPLLGPETAVVTAQNGIPWWFFHGFKGHEDKRVTCVDPNGIIGGAIPPARVLGCVLHIGCAVPEPGLVVHNAQNRFMTYAPISVLTGATNDQVAGDPQVRQLCIDMIEEAGAVGDAYGLAQGMSADERVDLGGQLIGFRTSMLQDFDAGRPLELDAIVAAISEMGQMVGVPTPLIETIHGLAAQKGKLAGLY